MQELQRYLGLWIDELGKTAYIEHTAEAFRVTVTPSVTEPHSGAVDRDPWAALGASDPTFRLLATLERGERLWTLKVEAEAPDGRLWCLHLAVENTDPSAFGGYLWRDPLENDAPEDCRLIPGTRAGWLDAVCYMEDEAEIPWALPLTPFRRATAFEWARYRAHHPEVSHG